MTWVERASLPQDYDPDRLTERSLDGLAPSTVTASTLLFDGFVPDWALDWIERPSTSATWSER